MTEKMKPSGIAWIGDIPRSWKCKKLKYLISEPLQYGANEEGCDFDKTYPRYIRITDIEDNNQLKSDGKQSLLPSVAAPYILNDGDVLFARSGATVGKTFIYSSEVGCAAFAGYLIRASVDKKQILPKYLYYCTINGGYDNWKNSVFTQATIQNIGADKYAQFSIAFPSITEQQCIADFLDIQCAKIDSVIADIEKQIETLQKYKKSLITEAVTKGCIAGPKTKIVRLDFADEINEAWTETRVKYLCDMYSGDNLTSSDIEPEGDYPVYGGNGLRGFYAAYTNDGEHVLIGRQGALCGNVHLVSGKFWATDHAVVTYPYEGMCNGYLFYLFSAMNLNQYSQTAAQPGLAVAAIQNLRACIPPTTEIQQEIAKYLDEKCGKIDSIIGTKQKQLEIMEQHKKSLIYEYVTGKKRVTEAN